MKLPYWVNEEIYKFIAPSTGKVTITLEIYKDGVTKMEIGGSIRFKPEIKDEWLEKKVS